MKKVKLVSLALASVMAFSGLTAFNAKPAVKMAPAMTTVKATNWQSAPAASKSRKDTLVVQSPDLTGVWSKEFGTNTYDYYVCDVMFDYLVNPTADGEDTPNAATYKVSNGGKVYTFTLKKGIKYWDGKTPTAKDVEFWLYVLCDPKYTGAVDMSTLNLKGYDAYKKGSAKTISGIKVLSSNKIQITLTKANAAAIWTLNVPLMEKAHYDANFKKGDAKTVENALKNPMGTGAYKFVSYNAATGVKLVANNAYFKGKPKIANLQYTIVPEGKELQSVQTGETDLANANCTVDNMTQIKNAKFINAFYYTANVYGMIQWNLKEAKFKDYRVRQALAYGLDRAAVIKQVYGPYGKANDVPNTPASWGWTTTGTTNYKFNTSKARALLAQAGWKLDPKTNKLTKGGKTFVINFTCTAGNVVTDTMLPVMKQDYAKLGITVNIQHADWATLYNNYTAGKMDATFLANGLSNPDPDIYTTGFKTGGTQNYYKYSNKTLDKLLAAQIVETSHAKRIADFVKINKILNKELPVFTLYSRNDLWIANGRVNVVGSMSAFLDPFLNIYRWSLK